VKVTGCPTNDGEPDPRKTVCDWKRPLRLIHSSSTGDVLGWKLPEPRYEAVMAYLPLFSEDVVNEALPFTSVALASACLPSSMNTTVPVGVPEAELTIAVKVTGC